MLDFGWLNVGSLVLGLIALTLPIVNLSREKKEDNKAWVILSVISLSACAISICFQIFYTSHLVIIEDWSALLDTHKAVAIVSALLLIGTITLNVLTLVVYRDKAK
ncbi:hypothetical protein DS745_03670 [Anaerobacillus alkaliphilus]|uniref:Cytochrome c oxidase subunit 4 n=1 Tax=Anaerobacillus alkaliphilus TaxID=1548597 RepID=A0A4Q0VYM3_9BACI|nr:hypothetical protein [Anaerobacillus alkaliphilus]RXJ04492.1 hypothetical protein DS745_03670 [Anaerobacillus alkaliphilus]